MATGAVSRQIDATIDAEIRGLAEQYSQRGTGGLIDILSGRMRAGDRSGALYLLTDPTFRRLAGNLDGWPLEQPDAEGWVTFPLSDPDPAAKGINYGRARVFTLSGGLHLLVGHDVAERVRIAESIEGLLAVGLAVTVGMSLLGGLLMSRSLFRQFDRINQTSREIMAGDMSRRVPQSGRGDEFDQMAANLNAMLDQIELLLAGIKQVTDSIAHDLRTPLGRLRNRLDRALVEEADRAACREAMERAIDDADRLLKTFNALLSIGQAESGAPRRNFEPVDLGALVTDVVDLYEPVAEEKGLSLIVDAGLGATIKGDRTLLFQAVANLLDNSIKFSPADNSGANGEVGLSLGMEAEAARIVVWDRGPGISDHQRERVIERFYRLETSRSTPGSGLGLSLVAAVARLHGGRLELTDNAPGLRAELILPAEPWRQTAIGGRPTRSTRPSA
ncbi:MAG: HAMP domain-containing sensor histidine kinase [Defluviicoccus sp.]